MPIPLLYNLKKQSVIRQLSIIPPPRQTLAGYFLSAPYHNSGIKISGVSTDAVTLKFGEVETAIAGAFDSFASEKIFEDQNQALLA